MQMRPVPLNCDHDTLHAALPAFCYCAPNIWNNLSEQTKSSTSLDIFKHRIKTKLFSRVD